MFLYSHLVCAKLNFVCLLVTGVLLLAAIMGDHIAQVRVFTIQST